MVVVVVVVATQSAFHLRHIKVDKVEVELVSSAVKGFHRSTNVAFRHVKIGMNLFQIIERLN